MADWSSCLETVTTITGNQVQSPTIKCLEVVFERILEIIVSLASIALFLMLVIGGFKYLTSGGDQKATASAKQTLTYAIMGLVLMALALLVFRIIEAFTGVRVLDFVIPTI